MVFCRCTFVCLALDFVFQLTFFPAVVALQGRREARDKSYRPGCFKKKAKVCIESRRKHVYLRRTSLDHVCDGGACYPDDQNTTDDAILCRIWNVISISRCLQSMEYANANGSLKSNGAVVAAHEDDEPWIHPVARIFRDHYAPLLERKALQVPPHSSCLSYSGDSGYRRRPDVGGDDTSSGRANATSGKMACSVQNFRLP